MEVPGGGIATATFCTRLSMVDGKMVGLLQGDTGAFCHLCTCTRDDANNIDLIENGFKINKDYESCSAAWEKLQTGEVMYSSKDRQGQCHENIAKTDLLFFSILHAKLRSLGFCQKILYHLIAGQKDWTEKARNACFLDSAKAECIQHIRDTTGILMDTPTGNGGNTNSGPLATRYFDPKNRSNICSLILNSEDRGNYAQFLGYLNAFLAILQSVQSRKRDIDSVSKVGIEVMCHIKTGFLDEKGESWVYIIPTVHRMLGHAWELFPMNDGDPVARWSESPVESWNKYVRSFQSGVGSKARQSSVEENIHDILRRMLICSHPVIASKRPRPLCRICGEVGHTARSEGHRVTQDLNSNGNGSSDETIEDNLELSYDDKKIIDYVFEIMLDICYSHFISIQLCGCVIFFLEFYFQYILCENFTNSSQFLVHFCSLIDHLGSYKPNFKENMDYLYCLNTYLQT